MRGGLSVPYLKSFHSSSLWHTLRRTVQSDANRPNKENAAVVESNWKCAFVCGEQNAFVLYPYPLSLIQLHHENMHTQRPGQGGAKPVRADRLQRVQVNRKLHNHTLQTLYCLASVNCRYKMTQNLPLYLQLVQNLLIKSAVYATLIYLFFRSVLLAVLA